MRIVEKHGMFKNRWRGVNPKRIILHHTAGGSVSGAEATLGKRGLGYHYIIDKKGTVNEYVSANRYTPHAYKNNYNTVGVCFVGGGKFGPASPEQIASCIQLCKILKQDYPSIKEISGHKHVDPRGWKIDPRFAGEPVLGVDWKLDEAQMTKIAKATDLKFVSRKDIYGKRWKP